LAGWPERFGRRRSARPIFVADAYRDDGQRFIVRADEKSTAFVELESAIRLRQVYLTSRRDFFENPTQVGLARAEDSPPPGSLLSMVKS